MHFSSPSYNPTLNYVFLAINVLSFGPFNRTRVATLERKIPKPCLPFSASMFNFVYRAAASTAALLENEVNQNEMKLPLPMPMMVPCVCCELFLNMSQGKDEPNDGVKR